MTPATRRSVLAAVPRCVCGRVSVVVVVEGDRYTARCRRCAGGAKARPVRGRRRGPAEQPALWPAETAREGNEA